ncbi:MAG: hypothetical protein LBR06_01310 [Bacteroidales bacterium]|nr:hypothetical protein [Bacteroidales bacterium]
MKSLLQITIFVLIFGLTFSCSKEISVGPSNDEHLLEIPQQSNTLKIAFTFELPAASTKALTLAAENAVIHADVLSFRVSGQTETYDSHAGTATITDVPGSDGARKQFVVELPRKAGNYKLVVLTNLPEELRIKLFHISGVKTAVLNALTLTANSWQADSPAPGDFMPIPMWAEVPGTVAIDDALSLSGINDLHLLRMVSRIDVFIQPAARNQFRLSDVYLYNRNTKGLPAPAQNAVSIGGDGHVSVTAATVPAQSGKMLSPLIYTTPDDTALVNSIYTLEAKGPADRNKYEDATCIVLGGYFGTDFAKTYYRVDLRDAARNFRDLLRNHCYIFSVKAVLDRGFPTAQEAFDSTPVSISVDVLVQSWQDLTINKILEVK